MKYKVEHMVNINVTLEFSVPFFLYIQDQSNIYMLTLALIDVHVYKFVEKEL
jgi:hypothetical protein